MPPPFCSKGVGGLSLKQRDRDRDHKEQERKLIPIILIALGLLATSIEANENSLDDTAYWDRLGQSIAPLILPTLKTIALAGALRAARSLGDTEQQDSDSWEESWQRRSRQFIIDFLTISGTISIIKTTYEAYRDRGLESTLSWTRSTERANKIAVTEATRFYSWGSLEEKKFRDINDKTWYTALDDNVCEVCKPMEGITVPIDEDFTLPTGERVPHAPAHPECRCEDR
ncbi:MAG: hypothetical protein GF347_00580 [Candidatus Moranbacteria bacterium]|nr:hypothetical protein [Candidatus Moranbacteria bacterium]